MPWRIAHNVKGCSDYAVVKESDGSVVGCHPTEDKAKAHLRALYANEPSQKGLTLHRTAGGENGGSARMNTFKIFAPTMIASRGDDGKLRIEGVASSTVRDHHGDQLTHKALRKMAESAKGLTIFLNHEYKVPEDVFGTVERVKLERTGVVDESTKEEIFDLKMGIVVQKANPRAVAAFEQMEAGPDKTPTKLGLSIGAMVPDGGAKFDKTKGGRYIIDDVDLVETSLVSMPANPRSWVDYAVKSVAKTLAEANDLPLQITKQRSALTELMEAEGVEIVDEMPDEDLVDKAAAKDIDTEEQKLGTEGVPMEDDPAEDHKQPDVNDSASDEQETQDEEGTKVPVNDNNVEGVSDTDDKKASLVTVWDGDKVVEVNTGRSKPKDSSAQDDDAPENAGSSGKTKAADSEDVVKAALETGDALLKSVVGQLNASRAENETLRAERDAAIELAKQSFESTQEILAKVAAMPAGRKTGFVDITEEFAAIRDDIYDADVRKLLLKKG